MMMALDDFIFETGTLPYQQKQRATDWRYAESERFGARKATQFIGPGDDKITLSGALYPGEVGSYSSIETIKAMADTGNALTMTAGTGEVMGQWTIRSLNITESVFFVDGVARKADFTLELERTDDTSAT